MLWLRILKIFLVLETRRALTNKISTKKSFSRGWTS